MIVDEVDNECILQESQQVEGQEDRKQDVPYVWPRRQTQQDKLLDSGHIAQLQGPLHLRTKHIYKIWCNSISLHLPHPRSSHCLTQVNEITAYLVSLLPFLPSAVLHVAASGDFQNHRSYSVLLSCLKLTDFPIIFRINIIFLFMVFNLSNFLIPVNCFRLTHVMILLTSNEDLWAPIHFLKSSMVLQALRNSHTDFFLPGPSLFPFSLFPFLRNLTSLV